MRPVPILAPTVLEMTGTEGRSYDVDVMALSQITWRDVQQTPEDGKRREAIEGEMFVTAAPSFRHQRTSARLLVRLHDLLEAPGHGIVVAAPVGVEFPATGEGVQPDLVYVAEDRRGIADEDWIRGAPDLVVEILSPGTEARDRGVKLKLYRRQGVARYWIVDPEAETVEAWRFEGGEPVCRRFSDRLPVAVAGEEVGEIRLRELFERP